MFNIKFADPVEMPISEKPCYVCSATEFTPILTVDRAHYIGKDLDVGECTSCGTMNFLNEDPVLGYDYTGFDEEYWYNYVQNGAGITAMLEPLLAIDRPRNASVLDIGCGFGFVPHFWSQNGYGEAVGLETSIYGKVGREKLGIDIIHSYYNDAAAIQGQKFDYVFSSEVIEHVDNPAAFLDEIGQGLADDGILVLTTPSAQAVSKDTDATTLIASLSPGFHFFIASQDALKTLLENAGYAHVLVRDAGHRLFAWASHKPLPKISDGFSDWPTYLEYLSKLANHSDPHIASGAQYRLLKDSINLGMFDRADGIFPQFAKTCKAHFDLDLFDIKASESRRRSRKEMDNKTFPSWMGCGFYFAARYLEHNGDPVETRLALLEAAVETMEVEIDLAAQFAGEPAYFVSHARDRLRMTQALGAKNLKKTGFFQKLFGK